MATYRQRLLAEYLRGAPSIENTPPPGYVPTDEPMHHYTRPWAGRQMPSGPVVSRTQPQQRVAALPQATQRPVIGPHPPGYLPDGGEMYEYRQQRMHPEGPTITRTAPEPPTRSVPGYDEASATVAGPVPQQTEATMPEQVPGITPIDALYGELDLFNQQPIDYSQMQAVEKARQEQGRRNMLAGMAMSSFGGSRWSPLGQALAQQGMEQGLPLRPNAADIGYFNPETGEFVENPLMERRRREDLITGRIDAMVAEREAQAKLLDARGKHEDAQRIREENVELRRQAEIGRNQRAADRLAASQGKPISGLVSMNDGGPVRVGPDGGYIDAKGNPTNVLSPTGYEKRQEAIRGANYGYAKLDDIIAEVRDNEDAFGIVPGMVSNVPWLAERALSEEQRRARIRVYEQAYKAINALAGAALSVHEQMRLEQFLPKEKDSASNIVLKMQNAQGEYQRILAERGQRVPGTQTEERQTVSPETGVVPGGAVESMGGRRKK